MRRSPYSLPYLVPQTKGALQTLVDLGIADLGAHHVFLRERPHRRLPRLNVVERRVQRVEAHDDLAAQRVPAEQRDVLVGLQQREEVGRRGFDQVDLAGQQRVRGGGGIGDGQPFDAIDLGDLAAGQHRGRLAARLVARVLHVDDLLARLPFVLLQHEGAGAGVVVDLLVRVGVGDALGHHEGHVRRRLAQRLQHQAERLLEDDGEGLGVDRLDVAGGLEQDLPEAVARAPALDRGDAVLGRDRGAVAPFQPVAQRDRPGQLVVGNGVLLRHLGLDLEIGVLGEQDVIDHVAVVARDQRRGPDRVEDLDVGMRHHAQGLCSRRRGRHRQADRGGPHRQPLPQTHHTRTLPMLDSTHPLQPS